MRLFVAIELDLPIREELARIQSILLRKHGQTLRLTDPEALHVTLKFLGEVEDPRPCEEALAQVAQSTPTFTMSLTRCGVFPPRGVPRIIWCGVADPQQTLLDCHAACEREYAALGFPPEEREYHPHITIARCSDRSNRPDEKLSDWIKKCEVTAHSQEVRHLTLMESRLGARPAYVPRVEVKLRDSSG
jgi:RNA 2',3'-cyclic 3'-phosphodiesterase